MAISASSYAVGNRLYKGATSAPTRGRVDPTGYVDRELNKVASNSRSGIASSALRRMGTGGNLQAPQQTQQAPTQAAPQSQVGMTGQAKGLGGMPTVGANSALGRAVVRMTPIGKLEAPKLKSPTDLPFDPEKADAETELMGQKNDFAFQSRQARNDLERQYALGTRTIQEEQPANMRRLLENYAGRGLAYSSGYAYDQGEVQRQYANQLGDLEQGRTGGLASLLEQEGLFNNQYGMRMSSIQAAAARRAAEQAAEIEMENDAKKAEYERQLAEQQALRGPNANEVYVPSNPDYAYDNRYNSPNMNINPDNPLIAAPSVGAPAGASPVINGPGRNIRPNPLFTPPPPPQPAPVSPPPQYVPQTWNNAGTRRGRTS